MTSLLRRSVRCRWMGIISAFLLVAVLAIPVGVLRGGEPAKADPKMSQSGRDGFLAGRHTATGMDCAACHKGSPEKKPSMTVCLECHGPYDKLAAKGEKLEPNPHMSHLGELECDNCHHGHKPSTDYCAQCHAFGLKVP